MHVAFFISSKAEVAVIVAVVDVASASTVTTPAAETLTSAALLDHTTVCGAKYSVSTTQERDTLPPLGTDAVVGDTVTEVTDGVPGTNRIEFANGDTENVFHTW